MKFEIKNRFTGAVQITAQIECDESASYSFKLGLAVKWALKAGAILRNVVLSGADLSGAILRNADLSGAILSNAILRNVVLSGADLSGAILSNAILRNADLSNADLRNADLSNADLRNADLSNADLRNADLRNADLRNADLSNADLRSYKSDFWMILHAAQAEVPGLVLALKEGRVDGSTYTGECACLVGTIANLRRVDVSTLERNASRPAEQWFAMIRRGDKPGDDSGGGFAAGKALEWAEEYCALAGIALSARSSDQGEG